jgi:hypothetical protein
LGTFSLPPVAVSWIFRVELCHCGGQRLSPHGMRCATLRSGRGGRRGGQAALSCPTVSSNSPSCRGRPLRWRHLFEHWWTEKERFGALPMPLPIRTLSRSSHRSLPMSRRGRLAIRGRARLPSVTRGWHSVGLFLSCCRLRPGGPICPQPLPNYSISSSTG